LRGSEAALKTFDPPFEQDLCIRNRDAAEVDEMERTVMAKTTRITIETEMLLVIRRAKAVLGWCPGCRAEVDVIALDHDNLAEPVTAAQIQEWLGTSELHFWQTANGPTQICLNSLFRSFELEQVQRFCRTNINPPDQSRRKQS
jgi:hypothetical protein